MNLDQLKLVDSIHLSFQKERVHRYVQYKRGFSKQTRLEKYIDEYIEEARDLVNPIGGYVVRRRGRLLVSPSSIPEPISRADFIVFSVCTIGSMLEDRARNLMRGGDILKGLIFDALGSAAVSEVRAKTAESICDLARRYGLKTSRAFEPGAGSHYWSIENQAFLFGNIDASQLGVRLTASYMIIPRKSISFVLGLGRCIEQAPNLFSCEGCPRETCIYRYVPVADGDQRD